MTPYIVAYILFGALFGCITGVEYSDRAHDDVRAPAIGFLAGLVWPATVAVAAVYLVFRLTRALFLSFAELLAPVGDRLGSWWVRRRPTVPRAKVLPKRHRP